MESSSVKEDLLHTFQALNEEDMASFKWYLTNGGNSYDPIPKAKLEKANIHDIVDIIVQKYELDKAVATTLCILKKINHNQLAEELKTKIRQSNAGFENMQWNQKFARSGLLNYNVILAGKIGVGKSAVGNTIIGKHIFHSRKSFEGLTKSLQKESVTFDGVHLDVYDTPGLFDMGRSNEDVMKMCQDLLKLDPTNPIVFLLVMKADSFSQEDSKVVKEIINFLPDWLYQNTWIIFTRGDELENEGITIEELIDDSKEIKALMQNIRGRYHVFNNKNQNRDQVKSLTEKLRNTPFNLCAETKFPRKKPSPSAEELCERRIVLLGSSGTGKSATGNTILGNAIFRTDSGTTSVTTKCEMQKAVVAERKMSVIDTPGLFNTSNISPEELAVEIGHSIYLSSPGPHAFLYVVDISKRFTEKERMVVQEFEMIFGEEVTKYMTVLFTHGDQLEGKSVDAVIKANPALTKLVNQFGARYHVLNNKDLNSRKQVTDLLDKIDRMVEENGGSYSNDMFKYAAMCQQIKKNMNIQSPDKTQDHKDKEPTRTDGEPDKKQEQSKDGMNKQLDEVGECGSLVEAHTENESEAEECSGFLKFFLRVWRWLCAIAKRVKGWMKRN